MKLRGRLQFADGQLLGRVGRLCLKAVTEHAYGNTGAQISDQCRAALVRFSDMLKHSLPRMVLARRQEPLYMFTDASYEPSNALGRAALVVSFSTQWVGPSGPSHRQSPAV